TRTHTELLILLLLSASPFLLFVSSGGSVVVVVVVVVDSSSLGVLAVSRIVFAEVFVVGSAFSPFSVLFYDSLPAAGVSFPVVVVIDPPLAGVAEVLGEGSVLLLSDDVSADCVLGDVEEDVDGVRRSS
ncbi:uncharacterized protein TM35_001001100, partial [Trypanosoma theileri]